MKKKQIISLVVMLAAVAALGGTYFVVKGINEKKQEEQQAEEETGNENTVNIFTLDKENVSEININNSTGNISIVKEDGFWVQKDTSVPIKQENVDEMLEMVSSFDAIRVLEEQSEDMSQYGLDAPKLTYDITVNDGTTHSISFGIPLVTDQSGYYARIDDSDKIYILSSNYYTPFDYSLIAMTEITDEVLINPEYITRFGVSGEEGTEFHATYFGEQDDTVSSSYYTWRIDSPYDNILADTDSMNEILNTFSDFSFEECVAFDTDDMAAYGLEQPRKTVELEYYTVVGASEEEESGEQAEATPVPESQRSYQAFVLNIGNTVTDGEKTLCYVSPEGSTNVYTIDNSVVESLTGFTAYSLADKCIYAVLVDQMQSYDVEYGGKKISVERKEVPKKEDSSDEGKKDDKETENEYYVNGKKVEAEGILTLYSASYLLTYSGEAKEEIANENNEEVFRITYHTNSGNDVIIKYMAYDGDNFYQVDKDGVNYFLTDKRGIDELIKRYDKYLEENNI